MANASTSSTEEEEHAFSSQFAALLKPIRELTKQGACWDLNIAAKLEEYVHYIAHLPIEVNVGGEQMKLDFAKAAMVVQNSVQIYSKKVENLWILLQEVIEFLSSHGANADNAEDGQTPAGANRLKRTRRRHQKGEVDLLQPVSLKFRKFNTKIKKKNVPAKELKKMQTVPYEILQLEEAVNSANPLKIKLYTLSNEHLGYPSDLRSNFLFDPVSFFLKIDNCPIMNHPVVQNPHSLQDETPPPILEPSLPVPAQPPQESFDDEMDDEPPNLDWQNDVDDVASEGEANPVEQPENQELPVERNMQLRQRENLERIPTPAQEVSDPWRGMDPYTDEESIKKPCGPPVKIKLPEALQKEVSRKRKGVGKDPVNDTTVSVGIDEYLGQVQRGALNNKKPNGKIPQPDSEFWEDFVHFSKTTGSRIRKQLREKHDVNEAENMVDDDDSVDHRDDANNNDDPPELDDPPRFGGMNDDDDFHFDPIAGEPPLSPTKDLDDTKQFFQLVQEFMIEYTASAQNFVQQTESTKRVQAWHAMIQPRLQEAESRRDFDIHLYGSRILETFGNEAPIGSLTNFARVVQKEPKNEVARYFLAALQLANTYNVEIGPQGGLEMDGVQLKLLSMERHHEHMDDFV